MGPARRMDSNMELRRVVHRGAVPKVLRLVVLAAEREERTSSWRCGWLIISRMVDDTVAWRFVRPVQTMMVRISVFLLECVMMMRFS